MKTMSEAKKGNGGRPEVLTLELARQIVKLIERLPDAAIPVTWKNVEFHVKRQFGKTLRRNVLSQKQWGDRKLIAEAFTEAKRVQRRLAKQEAPKYESSPRSVLRKAIQQLEATVLGLKEELEQTRAMQYTSLDLFRATRLDLQQMVEKAQAGKGKGA
jgi:multidrug resistance efflux pump